jgi:RNA-directed DNA polymerase
VVDADMKSYFDSIPHALLMVEVEKFVSDGKVLKLIQTYLEQDILDGMNCWTPIVGTPQAMAFT